eukprot:evm.model.NODE_16750_length_12696_cov_35.850582.5
MYASSAFTSCKGSESEILSLTRTSSPIPDPLFLPPEGLVASMDKLTFSPPDLIE